MKSHLCPSVNELAAFRAGTLPLDDHFRIAKHVKGCAACLRKSQVFAGPSIADDTVEDAESTFSSELAETIPESVPTAPTRLGPYLLKRVIGRGGMGVVYEAEHVRLRNRVAVKMLSRTLIADPEALSRFQREWEAVGRLSHPNVVRAFHADDCDGIPFLAMEYIEGADIASIIANHGPVNSADAAAIIYQAALGLSHAHEQGVIHRDVKPNNLLLTMDGTVKLLDLGLARLTANAPDSRVSGVVMLGTADYMAPEQWQGGPCDARTDLYSLGCVLHFLLTGRPPFSSSRFTTSHAKMQAHMHVLPPGVTAPTELSLLLTQLLAKRPNERIQSAAELCSTLKPLAHDANLTLLVSNRYGPPTTASRAEQETRPIAAHFRSTAGRPKSTSWAGFWHTVRQLFTRSVTRP